METGFSFYVRECGADWYRCRECGGLQRGQPPPMCPICGNLNPKKEESKNNESKNGLRRMP